MSDFTEQRTEQIVDENIDWFVKETHRCYMKGASDAMIKLTSMVLEQLDPATGCISVEDFKQAVVRGEQSK